MAHDESEAAEGVLKTYWFRMAHDESEAAEGSTVPLLQLCTDGFLWAVLNESLEVTIPASPQPFLCYSIYASPG